ncbi:MAG TPA: cell division protein FtsZ, partial [Rhodoblastus sp.]|nr:cell division protein FtsZ [Rhodoblastus sp.]
TTFADAFAMADQVLYSGVASITDLMVKQGLVNLDFADVRSIMREMGKAMMGTGEASGDQRAIHAAEAAIANPLLDEVSMKGAKGLLISITGGADMTLYEVDEAASRIRQEVDEDANIILGATFDESLAGVIRVSVVATGIDKPAMTAEIEDAQSKIAEAAERLRQQAMARAAAAPAPQREPEPVVAQQAAADHAAAYSQAQQAAIAHAQALAAAQAQAFAQAQAAAQPAPEPVEQVHVAPVAPPPGYYPAPAEPVAVEHPQRAPGPYVPPAPEQPVRQPRIPQIDDMPAHVQKQWHEARAEGQGNAVSAVEQRRRTLFERLTSFGASREEAARAQVEPQMARPAPVAPPQARPAQPAASHAEYAKRPVQPAARPAGADAYGRVAPARPSEEEQLEIPAFLRRQSS